MAIALLYKREMDKWFLEGWVILHLQRLIDYLILRKNHIEHGNILHIHVSETKGSHIKNEIIQQEAEYFYSTHTLGKSYHTEQWKVSRVHKPNQNNEKKKVGKWVKSENTTHFYEKLRKERKDLVKY